MIITEIPQDRTATATATVATATTTVTTTQNRQVAHQLLRYRCPACFGREEWGGNAET